MKHQKLYSKLTLIILMLVTTLTLFCFPNNKVKADNLSSLEIKNYEKSLNPEFNPNTYEYSIGILPNELELKINYEKENSNDKVSITGNKYMKNPSGDIQIKVGDNTYTIHYNRISIDNEFNFECINGPQYFNAPIGGRYILETWGAQGAGYDLPGNSYAGYGGKGGYSKGVISLNTSDKLHIYVGCTGSFSANGIAYGGYNGGGAAYTTQTEDPANGGGGATDIRINSDSLYSRVIVAGGGGGGSEDYPDSSHSSEKSGGAGGGISGTGNTNGNNYGGTQTSASGGATFGYGANTPNDGGGGGGGWYGGGTINGSQSLPTSNNNADTNGGSGGSGFVLNSSSILDVPTGYLLDEQYYLSNSYTIDGEKEMIMPDGTTDIGRKGDGYARITPYPYDFEYDKDNYLIDIVPSVGTLSTTFDPTIEEYNVDVDTFDQYISFDVTKSNQNATVLMDETYLLNKSITSIDIMVTAENGEVRIYKITVNRPELSSNNHSTKIKKITHFDNQEIYPLKDEYNFNISIPDYKSRVDIDIELYDKDAKYSVSGNRLLSDTGVITITVTESHSQTSTYNLNYTKYAINKINNFECTKNTQMYNIPVTGQYLLEVWGSQGSGSNSNPVSDVGVGGAGGYSHGIINLNRDENLFVEVGCYGTTTVTGRAYGGYNGGGDAFSDLSNDPAAGGGGATDIRVGENSLYSRVIVAGGGGGGSEDSSETAGAGGGVTGLGNSKGQNYGGTQTSSSGGGVFGYGAHTANDGGGGGGGWYGGGTIGGSQTIPTSNTDADTNGGSGGSGFVLTEETYSYVPEGYLLDSKYFLSEADTINGTLSMPSPTSEEKQIGNNGQGYARITYIQPKSDDYFLKTLSSDKGEWDKTFDPLNNEYIINVDMYTQKITLNGEKNSSLSAVIGLGEYALDIGENSIDIVVIAENGAINSYNLKVIRSDLESNVHTAELNKLLIEGYEDLLFEKNQYEYEISILPSEAHLNIKVIPYDSEEKYTIEGNEILDDDLGVITIISTESHSDTKIYTIRYIKEVSDYTREYSCTEDVQEYTAPIGSKYLIEVWGAQGGGGTLSDLSPGGKGGYSKGQIELKKGQKLYVYVGCKGKEADSGIAYGGYNGGGAAFGTRAAEGAAGGGGATDIRVLEDNLYSRFIVAGGGGGGGEDYRNDNMDYAGVGGGLTGGGSTTSRPTSYGSGLDPNYGDYGGTQIGASHGAIFGYGASTPRDGGAGGGGWYGGGTPGGSQKLPTENDENDTSGGSGGSGFVLTNETVLFVPDGYLLDKKYYLEKAETISGDKEIPTYDGEDTMIGNEGNGYAKITPIILSKDNYLDLLQTDKGEWNKEFNPLVDEYEVTLGVNDTKIKVSARPSSDLATIEGLGEYEIPAGTTEIEVKVRSESQDERVYKIKVRREASTESKAKNIQITGLVPNICNGKEEYCKLDTEFNEEKGRYEMTVPAGIKELEFTVDKKHEYQRVIGDGVTRLEAGDNTITIEVTSEDGENRSVYTYEITRDMSGDNYIDNLKVKPKKENGEELEEIDIGFNYLVTEYSFKVENDIKEIGLEVELDDEDAEYRIIGNEELKVGNNIVEIEVTASTGEVRSYILNVYRVSNDNNLLESLKIENKDTGEEISLNPEFKDITTSYIVTVGNEVKEIEVEGKAEETTSEVKGNGEYELKVGLNEINIIVTAENGEIEVYKIIVNRERNRNTNLKRLEIEEGEIEFDKEILEYEIEVEAHIKSLNITALPEEETSSVEIIGNKEFKIGENEVIVRVTSESKEIKEYKIKVIKEGSDNNYLSDLKVNKETIIGFNKETEEYEIEVGNEEKTIEIEGIKEDSLATVKGNGRYKLTTGLNEIIIEVESETGNKKEYKVKVKREYNDEARLKGIEISVGDLEPEFNSDILEYTINVDDDVEKMNIKGVPIEETTKVEGNGEKRIEKGENNIEIETTSEKGSKLTYKIKVVRDKNKNTNLKSLIVKEGSLNPSFDKMKLNYEVRVPNKVEAVTVLAEAESSTSKVEIEGNENLEEGENIVTVRVISETNEEKEYKIKVIRQGESETSLNLKTLDISSCELNPEFNGEINYYECEVENEIEKVIVRGEAEDELNEIEGEGEKNLKVGENLIVVKVKNLDNQENSYQIKITRKKSREARLKSLVVKDHNLNEAYDKDILSYTLTTKERNLEIEYEKMHEGEKVEIEGNEGLELGENEVKIKVTAEDGETKKVYEITVTKEKSNNAYLKRLEVEEHELNPSFNKGIYNYKVEVENEEVSAVIKAEAEDENASISGKGMRSLNVGKNELEIEVTAEDGETKKTYKIEIIRKGSDNNYLKSLEIKGEEVEFNKEINEYEIEVEYEVDEIEIEAETEDENASISGEGKVSLKVGENEKNIIVTSESGKIRIYRIKVTRKNPVTSLLENIEVKNYRLEEEFESNKTNYTVTVDNEVESLELIISKLDPNSTYIVEGNENLEVGLNEIKIISTSSDESEETTYTLTVNRQIYSNTYLSNLIVSEGELEPEFEKTTLSYRVEVGNEIEEIEVEGSAENGSSEVSGNGRYRLSVGENKIYVTVTSQGGIKRTYNVVVERKGSNEAGIESIRSTEGEISKINETEYKLVVEKGIKEITKNQIIVVPKDSMAEVIKEEKIEIEEDNEYNIRVISADKEHEEDYTIRVEYKKSSDARLKSLSYTEGELEPSFNKDTKVYRLNVYDNVKEVELDGEVNEENAEIITENKIFTLEGKETEADLTVQAEDGTIEIYKINIVKSKTIEKTLRSIELTGIKEKCEECILPEYNETTYEYEITVPYEIDEIGFEIEKKHEAEEVKILKEGEEVKKYVLDVGENIYIVRVTNSKGEELEYVYKITRLKSNNNYLKSLKLTSPEKEIEDFEKTKQEYSVTVPNEYENVVVEAKAEDEINARVTIKGATYLIEGINEVKIRVKAGNGEIREYILHVTRAPESNNLLKTLTVSSGKIYTLSPKFSSGVEEYTLEVPSAISTINVEGIAEDEENATVRGNGEYELKIGKNKIEIEVESKEGEKRKYTIEVTRSASKNVYLKRLEIENGEIIEEFNAMKERYEVRVGNEVERLELEAEAEDENASIEIIGNEDLEVGENIVKIKVTSSDRTAAKTYILVVNKEGTNENRLKNILIDKVGIEGFNEEVLEYEVEVENIKNYVEIEVEKKEEQEKVKGEGGYALSVGENIIKIEVEAENGEKREYKVTIKRKKNTYLSNIYTSLYDQTVIEPYDKTVMKYELEVENSIEEITILGMKEDKEAEVSGNGNYKLEIGENVITLTVTNGEEEREYEVKVIRKGSDNNYLKYLTVGEGEIEFEKETLEYEVHVPNEVKSLTLDYGPEDEKAKVEEIGNENIEEKGEVIIRVTSTSGKIREYIVHVIKEEESYFNNKLKRLEVDEGTLSPRFEGDTSYYTVTVGKTVSIIEIEAEAENENAIVEGIGKINLDVTKTREEKKITVTSEDGKKRVYTIVIFRNKELDARLSKLSFENGKLSPSFSKNTTNYTLKIESDEELVRIKEIKAVEEEAKIEISNLLVKEAEGKITITSKVEDISKTYEINLKIVKSSNAYLKSITSSTGDLSPEFNKTKNVYTIKVGKEVNSFTIEAEAESTKTEINGTGKNKVEINVTKEEKINIVLTSENGNINTYTVIIEREEEEKGLESLTIKDEDEKEYEIGFSKEKLEYEIEVEKDIKYIRISGETKEVGAVIEGLGVKEIEKGKNIYKVKVISNDKTETIYTITAKTKETKSSKISNLRFKEGKLSPEFTSEELEYTLKVPNEITKVREIIELEDEEASYTISGNDNLKVGTNEVEIKVEREGIEETIYKIKVIRQIYSNNYLKELKLDGETIEEFNKEKIYYEVKVRREKETIEVEGIPELASSTVEGNREYRLEYGKNIIVIEVISETGVERVYQIEVEREAGSNNYLKDLKIGKETIEGFNKEILSYEIEVENKEIEIEGIAEEETSNVEGNGTYEIKTEETINILVTAENGSIRIYEIKVKRKKKNNLNLKEFIPSTGILSPEYSDEENKYEIEVGTGVNVIDIEVEPEEASTTVRGNKNIEIEGEETKVIIEVEAEDGSKREIEVTIKKAVGVTGIKVEKELMIMIGEEKEIEYEVEPESASNKEVEFEYDSEYIEIEGNKVKGKKKGKVELIIKSKDNELIKETIEVTVIGDKIESKEYEVKEKKLDKEYRYVVGAEEGEIISDFKDKLLNPKELIKIYDKEGKEVEESSIVKTGLVIKLEINGIVYDEGIMIVRGDLNEDGLIDISDKVVLQNHLLAKETITNYILLSADVENDGLVDVSDNVKLGNYILRKITTLN